MTQAKGMIIRRLGPGDAAAVVDCFRRVYGGSYANELFHDPGGLAEAMAAGRIGAVGALDEDGQVLGHMAMTRHPGAGTVELGNTAVDPAARGQGLAWQIGAALRDWCLELGYRGYLHYPTTDHHVMQRQSVKAGFEVGLMLGYIPAETDARMSDREPRGRQAATIVYEPLVRGGPESAQAAELALYLPGYGAELVRGFAEAAGLVRRWHAPDKVSNGISELSHAMHHKRGLLRTTVARSGSDLATRLKQADTQAGADGQTAWPCRQIDFSMDDPGIGQGVETARQLGYRFCGWLPGFARTDVLRMQQVDPECTNLSPDLVNPTARALLVWCL